MSKTLLFGISDSPMVTAGKSVDENGVNIRRTIKDVLHQGIYIHPKAGWRLNVTPELLDGMVNTFKKMQENGVQVELTLDHSPSARDVIGKVLDVWVAEADTKIGPRLALFTMNEFRGNESIGLSERVNQVSVEIETFKDGKGVEYKDALTAVSLVQKPVIPGQRDFIAASRQNSLDTDANKMLFFDLKNDTPSKVNTMKVFHAAIRKSFNLADDVELPEDEAKLSEKVLELSAQFSTKAKASVDDKDKEILALKQKLKDMEKEGRKSASLTDEQREVLDDRADIVRERAGELVGKTVEITPALAEKLAASLIPAGDATKKVMLSRGVEGAQPIARQVIDVLGEQATNTVSQQTTTTAQHLSLNADDEKPNEETQDILSGMRSVAGLKPAE